MIRFVVEKLIGTTAVLIAISIAIFCMGSLIPGDLVTVLVGSEGATQEQYQALREELGLNDPLPIQYARWLYNALQGDFGISPITHRSVTDEISRQLPVSLELAVLAMLLSTMLGIPIGIFAAARANHIGDLLLRSVFLFAFSLPPFVSGILLLLIGAFYFTSFYKAAYVPLNESVLGNIQSMFLPTISIAIPLAAMTIQMTRTTIMESLGEPFITGARARGATEWNIFYIHALKNALPSIITLQGFQFGSLLGGMIVIEQVYNLPGLGRGLLAGIGQRDYPFVITATMIIATSYVFVNLAIDILYPLIDPRQRAS